MYLTIINDCHDPGTMNRQIVRAATLFPGMQISPVAVGNFSDLEAAGLIIDTLDASLGQPGVILANVAPRGGKAVVWPNGTPFGHLVVGQTHLFVTVDGLTLSLLRKYGLAETIEVYDIPTVLDTVISRGLLPELKRDFISQSQFRSFEFLPRVAKWVMDRIPLPSEKHALSQFLPAPQAVWYIDNFGNCKTTVWASEVPFHPEQTLATRWGQLPAYLRLKDVPTGEPGIIIGSSGLDERRFLEIVVQRGSAADRFGIACGDPLFP